MYGKEEESAVRTLWMAKATIAALPVDYYLLAEENGGAGESYGVAVALEGGESSSVRNVTLSQREILRLVGALVRGRVTPASLQDVVEDWLLR
jgi:hypothetical protein